MNEVEKIGDKGVLFTELSSKYGTYNGKTHQILRGDNLNQIIDSLWDLTRLAYFLDNADNVKSLNQGKSAIIEVSKISDRTIFSTVIKALNGKSIQEHLGQSLSRRLHHLLIKRGIESVRVNCEEISFTDYDGLILLFSKQKLGRLL